MIHILSSASASGSLQFALKKMGLDKKERIIFFNDIFSVGPVWKLSEEIGVKSRDEWMKQSMSDKFFEYNGYRERFEMVMNQINLIPDGEHVTIWVSDNAHEQTGMRYIVHLLKEKNIDITVINTTAAYKELFQVKKVKYKVLHTGEIPSEKLQFIYEQDFGQFLTLITDHDREELEREWLSLGESHETLRVWRNGRLQSITEDYYDDFIVKKAKRLFGKQNEFISVARVIGEVLGHLDQYLGDAFLEYRIRKLINSGVFELEGDLRSRCFYSLKLNRNESD
ncbi:DUF1835 domain-containing protein [Oceanobacillus caeni]|uniref:DUF1835 domain-containing protein n=1 Tax=Oceanobacillus caeni TaxID=405946 RepID=A0ABR5MGE3_9BACI|nr:MULTISPECIES: DUF1835 domain-containing protein [Bacillaceae]KKE80355.1 hypothetical protein WH51_02450 [Bacilli bacterium VT-13-104]PZD83543.1 DUF1835 domain-containing protein [Bacilli bacterium]KPH71667.1 hypothetical protein AFL42_14725 [Oceanobacillus caeni]MBU8790991.1 DUF1835 domain-containing protein [Oceanobacillus caeni]MCR1833558.1 DUF1835 domain-containing protein [Oceanobacillus caeni]